MVPKEAPSGYCKLLDKAPSMAPSVTNIVWAPSVAPSMAPSVAPSVIISLIGFPVPPRFEVFSLHPEFKLDCLVLVIALYTFLVCWITSWNPPPKPIRNGS